MNDSWRTLVVDDESLARARVTRLLRAHEDVEVVGEAASLGEAERLYAELSPDLIFLDIEMPDGTGFELFERADISCPVIFVTAYDEHAVRAFEVNALDYLLKPLEAKRLAQSLGRLRQRAGEQSSPRLRSGDRIAFRADGVLRFLALDEVASVESAGDYSELHCVDGRSWLCSQTMREWEARLPAEHFLRIHRATIVALRQVVELAPTSGSTFEIRLAGTGRRLGVSRSSLKRLRERLSRLEG